MAKLGSVGVEELLGQADWLRRLARHLVGEAGEDMAQEVWLAAHRAGPDRGRPARPWLSRVLRNISQARRRDEGRRLRHEQAYQDTLALDVSPVDVVYERLQLQRLLTEQVMALDESLRTVVVLRYFEELDSARIARLTGTPEGTVRWRLKLALDRLRAALDARHSGRRQAWVALLTPAALSSGTATTTGGATAASAPTTTRTITMATTTSKITVSAALALVALLLLSLGVFERWRRGRATPSSALSAVPRESAARPDGARVRPGKQGGGGVSGRGFLAAASPEDLPRCRLALDRTWREAEAHDRSARAWVPSAAFEAGAPNPRLHAEVRPQIAKLWSGDQAAPALKHEVECRAWACRLTVVVPADESGDVGPWIKSISPVVQVRRVRELKLRQVSLRGITLQLMGSSPTQEEGSSRSLEKFVFFFGASPANLETGEGPPQASAPVPLVESLTDCQRELSLVRDRVRSRVAELAGFQPMSEQFARGAAATTELTSRVQTASAAVLGSQHGVRAACRDAVCRIQFEGTPDPAKLENLAGSLEALLEGGGKITQEKAGNHEVYVTIARDGRQVLLGLLEPSRKPGFFHDCPEPERPGKVLLRLHVPSTGRRNDQGVHGRVSVRVVSGSLATTQSGVCLAERIGTLVSAEDLPSPIEDFLTFESWSWVPGKSPEKLDP
jgi:RNA polymerase sigma factor (sigma-70 family)